MARSIGRAPTALDQFFRLLEAHPDARFTPGQAAVLAMAHVGRPAVKSAELVAALAAVGFGSLAKANPPLASLVEAGWTQVKGERLAIATGQTADGLVNKLAARLRDGPGKAAAKSRMPAPAAGSSARAKAPGAPSGPARAPAGPTPRADAGYFPPVPKPPPVAPPPPPPPVRWDAFDLPGTAALLSARVARPADLLHSLEAHALAAADHFEELLALASLRGVEAHTYQTETVRRVLRHFRGRALLADEVGLGKTIRPAARAVRALCARGYGASGLRRVPKVGVIFRCLPPPRA